MEVVAFGPDQPFDLAGDGERKVLEVRFDTCKGSGLVCRLLQTLQSSSSSLVDERAVWTIETPQEPTRFVCLRGDECFRFFVDRYGYLDADQCVNFRQGTLHIGVPQTQAALPVPVRVLELHTVPQKSAFSGNCWFSSFCFSLLRRWRACWRPRFRRTASSLTAACTSRRSRAGEAAVLRAGVWRRPGGRRARTDKVCAQFYWQPRATFRSCASTTAGDPRTMRRPEEAGLPGATHGACGQVALLRAFVPHGGALRASATSSMSTSMLVGSTLWASIAVAN